MGKTTKWDQEKYINECKKIHGDIFNYSKVEFNGFNSRIIIICNEHGEFEQSARGHRKGRGCSMCSKNKKKNTISFTNEVKSIYQDKFDYSLINYKGDRVKVELICKIHGNFWQWPGHLLKGHCCQKCSKLARITEEEYVIQANIVHSNKYIYPSGEYKNKRTKMRIICPKHGDFYQLPKHHLNGIGCKECGESKGEKEIKKILESLNIIFEKEKRFDNCKYKKPLPFDFYIPYYNICIEYDGIQHYKSIEWFGGEESLSSNKVRDQIKTNFCIENDIKLIRISYKENIEEKLKCMKII